MTEMHTFCQNARKALEIANVVDNQILPTAYTLKLSGGGERVLSFDNDVGELTDQSFMWVLGRIIHSVSVWVPRESKHLSISQKSVYSESRRKYFAFGSDKDEPEAKPGGYVVHVEIMNFIKIEQFLGLYVGPLSRMIEEALKTLRPTRMT